MREHQTKVEKKKVEWENERERRWNPALKRKGEERIYSKRTEKKHQHKARLPSVSTSSCRSPLE